MRWLVAGFGVSSAHMSNEHVHHDHSIAPIADTMTIPERSFARFQATRANVNDTSGPRQRRDTTSATTRTMHNATFLTECSFRVAQERLVHVITDVHPFEPHWENLSSIDLSQKRLESVARMKEFLPKLDSLYL